jgi:hypothetical protein
MRKVLAAAVVMAAMLIADAATVWAGGGCCASKSAAAAGGSKSEICAALSGLSLDDEQKTQVDEAVSRCKEGGCTAESNAQLMKDLEGILSADQLAGVKEACLKSGHGCWMKK